MSKQQGKKDEEADFSDVRGAEEDHEAQVAEEDQAAEDEQEEEGNYQEEEQEEQDEYDEEDLDQEEGEEETNDAEGAESAYEEAKTTDGKEINTLSFDELVLDENACQAANDVWKQFINAAESREAAGEVIYAALFDSVPSMQSLFTTPRAVAAMKFMNGFSSFVMSLDDPPKLKILVETLGFGHLQLDVTVPRVVAFRDALLDIFAVELGDKFNRVARDAWSNLLNYIGGAIIFVKANYAERIQTLLESWAIASGGSQSNSNDPMSLASMDNGQGGAAGKQTTDNKQKKGQDSGLSTIFKKSATGSGKGVKENDELVAAGSAEKGGAAGGTNQVPTTYNEMFRFNAAVMGFASNAWMEEVLDCFDNIVTNVANSGRFQEECDVLVLRIARVQTKSVNFAEYKSCMLASLRSLLPQDWSSRHEVAWGWLWQNVERILQKNMGNPAKWEKALAKILGGLDENQAFEFRKNIYSRFFALAPAGQDFFKQSNTYLHFIADRVMQMTLDFYRDPVKMVDDISAVGLRHVGYGIGPEFFGPFVSACVEVMMTITDDTLGVESYRWSMGLISKILVRTIQEGSTIVMKAINDNSASLLKKAVSCAPRGERSSWLLTVQVGTQKISPLAWSIESGALHSAQAIIHDLLVVRADRDRYYYGMDALFARHPDIIKTLSVHAPTLLPKLLDGLIWRSRTTEGGVRRANYYIKHLLADTQGKFSPTLSWIAKTKDPHLVSHSVLVLLSDTVWSRLACRAFLWKKTWFLLTLSIFIASQSIIKHLNDGESTDVTRWTVFVLRCFIYGASLGQLLFIHTTRCFRNWRNKETINILGFIRIPRYLLNWQDAAGLLLTVCLVAMLLVEPVLWCLGNSGDKQFDEGCSEAENIRFPYSVLSMIAMTLYYVLLLDMAVLSTKVSAYVLVCIRMLSEVGLFLLALGAMLMAFGSSISALKHSQPEFEGLHESVFNLFHMPMRMFDGKHFDAYESDPLLAMMVYFFMVAVTVFLANMLVAQLTCAYEEVYGLMVGYARLERLEIIVLTMPNVAEKRWQAFLERLKLHEKCEFNAGDVGVVGGVQILEPANANPTTQDMIKRFGGSTSVEMQWPEDTDGADEDSDKLDRIETLIQRTLKRITKGGPGKGTLGSSNSQSDSKGEDTGGSEKSDELM